MFRSVPEIHQHVAGTLSNQKKTKTKQNKKPKKTKNKNKNKNKQPCRLTGPKTPTTNLVIGSTGVVRVWVWFRGMALLRHFYSALFLFLFNFSWFGPLTCVFSKIPLMFEVNSKMSWDANLHIQPVSPYPTPSPPPPPPLHSSHQFRLDF